MCTSSTGMPRIRPKKQLFAPSSRICADTYGISGASSDRPGTFTTQNVVITPVSWTSTSIDVGSPDFGSVPRDAAYTSSLDGRAAADDLPLAQALQVARRRDAGGELVLEPDRHGDAGDRLLVVGRARAASAGSGSSPSPSGTHASMSVIEPVRSARHSGATREPTRIASALPQSTTCSSAVSAPSGRISANANGLSSACLPGAGCATHVNDCTVPRGPTSIQWSPSARDRARSSSGRTPSAARARARRRASPRGCGRRAGR